MRGIRQGDSMSPYIFILYMEILSKMINHKINIRKWDTLKVTPTSPPLFHLFFVDDLRQGKYQNLTHYLGKP